MEQRWKAEVICPGNKTRPSRVCRAKAKAPANNSTQSRPRHELNKPLRNKPAGMRPFVLPTTACYLVCNRRLPDKPPAGCKNRPRDSAHPSSGLYIPSGFKGRCRPQNAISRKLFILLGFLPTPKFIVMCGKYESRQWRKASSPKRKRRPERRRFATIEKFAPIRTESGRRRWWPSYCD